MFLIVPLVLDYVGVLALGAFSALNSPIVVEGEILIRQSQ